MSVATPPIPSPTSPKVRRRRLPLLYAGDHLDQRTFHERYRAMAGDTRAELIEGIVYMAAAVMYDHCIPHGDVVFWLKQYQWRTAGVAVMTDGTTILGPRSQPQPDVALRIITGGQTRITSRGYCRGCPELVVEVANSTEAIDLHAKRREYDRHGAIEYVAVIVRDPRVAWFARDADGHLAEVPPDADGLFRSRAFPGLWLDPAALLAGDLDRLAAAIEQGVATPDHAAFVARLANPPA